MTDYYKKYIKYKLKYLNLKGGFYYCPPEARNGENHQVHNCELPIHQVNSVCEGTTERINNQCPVCLENYANVKLIPCCHRICSVCRPLLLNSNCPICRTLITGKFEQINNMWINEEHRDIPNKPKSIINKVDNPLNIIR